MSYTETAKFIASKGCKQISSKETFTQYLKSLGKERKNVHILSMDNFAFVAQPSDDKDSKILSFWGEPDLDVNYLAYLFKLTVEDNFKEIHNTETYTDLMSYNSSTIGCKALLAFGLSEMRKGNVNTPLMDIMKKYPQEHVQNLSWYKAWATALESVQHLEMEWVSNNGLFFYSTKPNKMFVCYVEQDKLLERANPTPFKSPYFKPTKEEHYKAYQVEVERFIDTLLSPKIVQQMLQKICLGPLETSPYSAMADIRKTEALRAMLKEGKHPMCDTLNRRLIKNYAPPFLGAMFSPARNALSAETSLHKLTFEIIQNHLG